MRRTRGKSTTKVKKKGDQKMIENIRNREILKKRKRTRRKALAAKLRR